MGIFNWIHRIQNIIIVVLLVALLYKNGHFDFVSFASGLVTMLVLSVILTDVFVARIEDVEEEDEEEKVHAEIDPL